MYNIIETPYSVHHLNALNKHNMSYSKRKYYDETQYEYNDTYLGFINNQKIDNRNNWGNNKFHGIGNNQNYEALTILNNNYMKSKNHNSKNKAQLISNNDSRQNIPLNHFNNQKFINLPQQNKIILIEDLPPHTKLKKTQNYTNSEQNYTFGDQLFIQNEQKKLVKKSMIDLSHQNPPKNNNNNINNLNKLHRKFPTFNNGAMLNSLADYSLNHLDDRMFNLSIDYSRNDIKNMSLDSLTNKGVRVKAKSPKNSPHKDEFAAYRLNENDTKVENKSLTNNNNSDNQSNFIKNKFSSLSSYNCSKLAENQVDKQKQGSSDSTTSSIESPDSLNKPKKTRHHHHRARRNNRNKNKNNSNMKKSMSSMADINNENEDSLSAFDFSNTDEFWEDDIIINSELIEPDKFLSDEIESPQVIKFASVSCEGLNAILKEAEEKFDLKESIIKDKLYEDILDFKDNLTIN